MNEMEQNPRRNLPEQQEWNPPVVLRILRAVWLALFSVFKVAVGAVATVLLVCTVCGLVFVGILGNYLQEDIIPNAELNLDNYDLDQTSFIYYQDTDGSIKELQKVYTTTDREWVPFDEIPKDLVHAVVAIEDKRFYEHQGVDWFTTSKACINMFFGGSSQFGGSTITQQLIKNITQEDSATVQRKVLEIFRAQQFERRYDKDVVLEWYLNTIYLGQDCYGIKTAAETYFGKHLQDLTTAECASLISITNNPSIFDPYGPEFEYDGKMTNGEERNRIRQLNVLNEMLNQGWITQQTYDSAITQEMVFKYGLDDEDETYTCPNYECFFTGTKEQFQLVDGEYLCPNCGSEVEINSNDVYSWFVDTVLEDVAEALAEQNGLNWNSETRKTCMELIKRGGYHIYSTLDMNVQKQMDSIYTNLDEIPEARSKQQLQSAMVVIDNRTGDIVAMSGGVGQKEVFDAYNRATDSMLQTGSAMKPLTVYSPAFELGVISPATVIHDLPYSYDDGAFPLNDVLEYNYARTIWRGVVDSVNAVAVNTLDIIGTQYSFNFATQRFRISTLTDSYQYDDGTVVSDINLAPLALGALTEGATVRDMTAAYATFANHGVYREARTFTKVYDSNGNLVIDNTQDSEQILSEKTVTYMNYCLEGVVDYGTGGAASISGIDVCGKTGSTSSFRDRWFCGFSGYYTAAVWCGYDTPEQIYLVGNYSNPAARLWYKVLAPLHEGKENISLYDYSGMSSKEICLDSGLLATDACKQDIRTKNEGLARTETVRAYWEDFPTETCDKHILVDYCVTGGGVANEYCSQFKDVKIEKRALVKMTMDEISELLKAKPYNLVSEYLSDDYIYLINDNGTPGHFTGLNGGLNKDQDVPYKVCTVHTKEALEKQNAATEPSKPNTTQPSTGTVTPPQQP